MHWLGPTRQISASQARIGMFVVFNHPILRGVEIDRRISQLGRYMNTSNWWTDFDCDHYWFPHTRTWHAKTTYLPEEKLTVRTDEKGKPLICETPYIHVRRSLKTS